MGAGPEPDGGLLQNAGRINNFCIASSLPKVKMSFPPPGSVGELESEGMDEIFFQLIE